MKYNLQLGNAEGRTSDGSPLMYAVDGLAKGEEAKIANFSVHDNDWVLYHSEGDIPMSHHKSREAALAFLQKKYDLQLC
jgi:hypothetical protein